MHTIGEENEDIIRELFDAVDLDASGFIDENELAAVVDLSPTDLKNVFQQLDTDNDGKISVEEFMDNYKHFQQVALESNKENANRDKSLEATRVHKVKYLNDKLRSSCDEEMQYDSGYSMSEPTHRKNRPPLKPEVKRIAAKYLGQDYLDDLYEIARSRNDPMLLESLESFLAATVDNLLQKQSDNEKLDVALKRATEKNTEIAMELEQEMEQQVAMLEEKIRQEEQRKLEQQKLEASKQITEAQAELKSMEEKVKELEKKVTEKENTPVIPDSVIDEIQKKDKENNALRNKLTEFQTQMALMRTEVAQMKAEYDDQADRLVNERGTVLNCVFEQENLTRQLHLLHEANKKLHDTNDDLRSALESQRVSFSNSPVPSPMKRSSSMGFGQRRPQTLFSSFRSDPGGFCAINDFNDTDDDSRHSVLPHDGDINEESLMAELMNAEAEHAASTPTRSGGTYTPRSINSPYQETPIENREIFVRQLDILCDTNRRLGESNDELRQALSILSDQLRNKNVEQRPRPTGAQSAPVTPSRSQHLEDEGRPQSTSSPRKVLLTKSGYHSLSTSRSMPDLSTSFENNMSASVVNDSESRDNSHSTVTTTQVETTEHIDNSTSINETFDKTNCIKCQCGNSTLNDDIMCEQCIGSKDDSIMSEITKSVYTEPIGDDLSETQSCTCQFKNGCNKCTPVSEISNPSAGEKSCNHICEKLECLCEQKADTSDKKITRDLSEEYPTENTTKTTPDSSHWMVNSTEVCEHEIEPLVIADEESVDDLLSKLSELSLPSPRICSKCQQEITLHPEVGIELCDCNKAIVDEIAESTILTDSDTSNNYSDQETKSEVLTKRVNPVGESDEDATYETGLGLSDTNWMSNLNSSYSLLQNFENELSMFARRQPDEEIDEDDMDDEELVRLVDQTNDEEITNDSVTEEPITVEEKILEPRGFAVGADTSSDSISRSGSGLNDSGTHDRMFKIVLAGNAAVGKSSFIIRLCKNKFYSALNSTLGVDFQLKTMQIGDENIALQLWDTAGQERFRSIAKSYFRRVDGVILLYDVTCENSFLDVREWIESIESSATKPIPVILCGNKIDLRPQAIACGMPVVSKEQGQKLANEVGALFVETSAKDGTNINRACRELTEQLQIMDDDAAKHGITLEPQKPSKKAGCCGRS